MIQNSLHKGKISVICGSMFSGKTEELIRRLRRSIIANRKVGIFKPHIDTRYSISHVVSHDKTAIPSTVVSNSESLFILAQNYEVIGIDEAQFFDVNLLDVVNQLANMGIEIHISGLDMDYMGKPFGIMPQLMAISEDVLKLHAVCVSCGYSALYSHRMTSNSELVALGEKDIYKPLCRNCKTNLES